MGQLLFQQNMLLTNQQLSVNNGTISFFPFNIYDSLSFRIFNIVIIGSNANRTVSYRVGLYSLTGSSLSIANSISGTRTQSNANVIYLNLTATSATQNITPGSWFFGMLCSISSNNVLSLFGQTRANPDNAFPGAFIGGRMTDSSNALPDSIATSNLDITGGDAMNVPMIILST